MSKYYFIEDYKVDDKIKSTPIVPNDSSIQFIVESMVMMPSAYLQLISEKE